MNGFYELGLAKKRTKAKEEEDFQKELAKSATEEQPTCGDTHASLDGELDALIAHYRGGHVPFKKAHAFLEKTTRAFEKGGVSALERSALACKLGRHTTT